MSTHKHIDLICLVAAILSIALCLLFANGEALGLQSSEKIMGYEDRLFDTTKVHSIDIRIDDWDAFIETAESEEYSVCSVVIDGEELKNVGIRGKGNTSLSSVSSMNSQRYSFKIEFDQYDSTISYHGLDKLCLNNIIQDNTYMKDYLSYQMMNSFGVAAPLCSYVYITVNGEDWGLYLAVEAIEDSFLQRNYGSDYGELYKPDSMSMGGGRGNGKDFDAAEFMEANEGTAENADGRFQPERGGDRNSQQQPTDRQFPGGQMQAPGGDMGGDMGKGMGGGMGSSDVKLQYIDDDPASYSNIFSSAKTSVTEADQSRLIASLKQLSEYKNLESVLDTEAVLRYFVVHNFVVNGDSYTGSMIHNYYLYEEDGRLSMIPWDYNLAFGSFQGANALSAVNEDIDSPLSDRPMQAWIFSDAAYTQRYYALYAQMLEQVDIQGIIENAYALIAPYVEKDPTAFCSYEEFLTGVETLKEFCALREQSVLLQLSGSDESVDVGTLDLSAMGSMGRGHDEIGGELPGGGTAAPEAPQMPEQPNGGAVPGAFPTQGVSPFGEAPSRGAEGMTPSGQNTPTAGTGGAAVMVISLAVLLLGIIIALKYKRR